MTTAPPPTFLDIVNFNPDFFEDISSILTKKECDARYLIKTEQDTATALETFTGGIKTNSIESVIDTNTLNIQTDSSTATNIVNIGNATTNNQTLNLNSKIINVGDTTVPSSININRPLKIGYTNIVTELGNSFDKIGSYSSVSSSEATIVNSVSAATSLVNFLSVPEGIYIFQYQINYRITVAHTVFTMQKFILSTTANNFNTFNIIGGELSSLFKTNSEHVDVSNPIDEYTQKFSNCGTIVLGGPSNVYLNYRIVHNASTTVPYIKATLRLVRIG